MSLSFSHFSKTKKKPKIKVNSKTHQSECKQQPSGGGKWEVCRVAGGEVARAVQWTATCWGTEEGGDGGRWEREKDSESMMNRYLILLSRIRPEKGWVIIHLRKWLDFPPLPWQDFQRFNKAAIDSGWEKPRAAESYKLFIFFLNRKRPIIDFFWRLLWALFIYLTFVQQTVSRNPDEWEAAFIRNVFFMDG